ncbi:MAG: DUF4365 domain-containing protein [Pirellulales bacterium]
MHPLRKRRTREHIIADLSANHVERFILRCGWVGQRMYPDYGIDIYMQTFNENGEIETGTVSIQLKATDNLKVVNGEAIAIRLDWRDVVFWLNESLPGILVIYDAPQERAWWTHLQQAVRALKPRNVGRLPHTATIHIPLANQLDEAAVRSFVKLRNAAIAEMGEPI